MLREWDETVINTKKNIKDQKKVLDSFDIGDIEKCMKKIPPLIKDFSDISIIEEKFFKIIKSTKNTRDELQATTKELIVAQRLMNKITVCPLCERPLL